MICTIEISDVAVTVATPDAVLAVVPGFAIVRPRELLIGEAAEALRRRQPRQVVSGFWSRLSMQALPVTGYKAGTWADLGFAQLCAAWEQALAAGDGPDGAVLAVPPGFGRDRLAVLLGITEHCPFDVVGLVDSGVAALVGQPPAATPAMLVDVGLTSATVTPVETLPGGELSSGTPVEFADAGLLAVQNAWVARIADQFIRETRYDPQHDAATEQHLYAQLPTWLAQLRAAPNVEIELQHGAARHRVVLDRTTLLDADRPRWQALRQHLAGCAALAVTRHAAAAGGLAETLGDLGVPMITLDATASARGVAAHISRISVRPDDGGYALIAALPAAAAAPVLQSPSEPPLQTRQAEPTPSTAHKQEPSAAHKQEPSAAHKQKPAPAPASAAAPAADFPAETAAEPAAEGGAGPSHLLIGATARPITRDVLHVGRGTGEGRWAGMVGLPSHLCDVWRADGAVHLRNVHAAGTRVNGVTVDGNHRLASGDVIEAVDTGVTVHAISVAPG